MSLKKCIGALHEPCKSLLLRYQEMEESLLKSALPDSLEQFCRSSAQLATYSLAASCVNRVLDAVAFSNEQPTLEQSVHFILNELTRELIALGGNVEQMKDRGRWQPALPERSMVLQLYDRTQKEVFQKVLDDIEPLLVSLLVEYGVHFLGEEAIQELDSVREITPTRVQAVSALCKQLSEAGKLDSTYAAIAQAIEKIGFPRDMWGEDDWQARGALPTFLRRLPIRDLLAFIASLKVQCLGAVDEPEIIMFGVQRAVQQVLEARWSSPPVPQRDLRVELLGDIAERLVRAGIQAHHKAPCIFCDREGRHCNIWQIVFPEGTTFGEPQQTEADRSRHVYSFTLTVPTILPSTWHIYLDYEGVWKPECPWQLTILDLAELQDPSAETSSPVTE